MNEHEAKVWADALTTETVQAEVSPYAFWRGPQHYSVAVAPKTKPHRKTYLFTTQQCLGATIKAREGPE
jgi:hypothetical protein